ncbi:MAG TPA: hypothetical protein VKZ79_14515 [Alphaproteobacteria bacterium]|nr:hypothetical protein [Alphaproteobacteria bacterium]
MTCTTIRRSFLVLGALATLGLAAPALAQEAQQPQAQPQPAPQAPPVRVRGKIESVTDDSITITKKNGTKQVVQTTPKLVVNALVKAKKDDIKPGVFIGTTARPNKDGKLEAIEVHIFPESMRGAGEGHYPWDTAPQDTMTNASVTDVVSAVHGETLSLKYKGGENQVTVVPTTSIVAVTPGSRDDLKKGAAIFAIAAPQPDGGLKTGFVLVGRGVNPPM